MKSETCHCFTMADIMSVCTAAIEAARRLGVEPVVSAKEMADPDVDHLGIMAYVARLRAAAAADTTKPTRRSVPPSKPSPDPTPLPPPPPPPPPLPPVTVDHSPMPRFDAGLVTATANFRRAPSPLTRRVHIQPPTSPGYVSRTVLVLCFFVCLRRQREALCFLVLRPSVRPLSVR